MSTPQSRFCANCGFPALPHDVNCSNCGRALAGAAPPPPVGPSSSSPFGGVTGIPSVGSSDPTLPPPGVLPPTPPAAGMSPGMPPPTGAPAPRSGMPGWVIGLIACLVVGPILLGVVGIGAAIVIPSMTKFAGHSASDGGKDNVQAIWTAEKSYAAAHGGKYSAFAITPTSQTDPGFTALGVTLPHELHHNVVGAYDGEDGKTFWIVATVSAGDPLYAKDCWELSSDTPTPVHTYDGVADKQLVEPKAPIEIAAASLLGGGAGDDGGVTGGSIGGGDEADAGPGGHGLADDPTIAEPEQAAAQAILATDSKSETAKANLEAIFAREKAWKAAHHSWLAFDEGNAGVWAKLGVRLPQPANHTYSAKVDGGALVLTAEGNLDDDPFVDLWQVDAATGIAVQEKSDSLNMDLTSVDKLFTAQAGGGGDQDE